MGQSHSGVRLSKHVHGRDRQLTWKTATVGLGKKKPRAKHTLKAPEKRRGGVGTKTDGFMLAASKVAIRT